GPGAIVDGTSATPIIQLAAASGIEFVADATATELAAVAPDQRATATLVMNHVELSGRVLGRSSSLDPPTGVGVVRVALDAPQAALPMGAFGRVVVTTRHRDGVLVAPVEALRGAVSDGAEVAICKDGKISLRPVRIGWRDATRFELMEGA